ncbi:MAG: hypothetical protein HC786_22025 [Richelia sp. CSU_2_1]|nr:hypothetical protein [Richelia sp. CSU_2_1]
MAKGGKTTGKSRDKRDRLTFDVGGLRDRLARFALYPTESLASIVRRALIEWLDRKESEKFNDNDKTDISTNEND